jgi:hypothetical protein
MNWPWLDKTTNGNTAVALPNVAWEPGDLVVPALLLNQITLPLRFRLRLRLRLLMFVLLIVFIGLHLRLRLRLLFPPLDQYILKILL